MAGRRRTIRTKGPLGGSVTRTTTQGGRDGTKNTVSVSGKHHKNQMGWTTVSKSGGKTTYVKTLKFGKLGGVQRTYSSGPRKSKSTPKMKINKSGGMDLGLAAGLGKLIKGLFGGNKPQQDAVIDQDTRDYTSGSDDIMKIIRKQEPKAGAWSSSKKEVEYWIGRFLEGNLLDSDDFEVLNKVKEMLIPGRRPPSDGSIIKMIQNRKTELNNNYTIPSKFNPLHPNAAIYEEAPTNSASAGHVAGIGIGTKGEPGRKGPLLRRNKFAGHTVFEVSANVFHKAKLGKKFKSHWRTYLEEDDCFHEIREFANSNPNEAIILQNEVTSEMVYCRYPKGKK